MSQSMTNDGAFTEKLKSFISGQKNTVQMYKYSRSGIWILNKKKENKRPLVLKETGRRCSISQVLGIYCSPITFFQWARPSENTLFNAQNFMLCHETIFFVILWIIYSVPKKKKCQELINIYSLVKTQPAIKGRQ